MSGDLFGYHPFHLWTVHQVAQQAEQAEQAATPSPNPHPMRGFWEAQRPSAHCTSLFPGSVPQVFRDGIPIPLHGL